MKALLATACGSFIALSAYADTSQPHLTGNQVLEYCEAAGDEAKQGFCVGYVVGVVEGMRWGAAVPLLRTEGPGPHLDSMVNTILSFCLPDGATWGQYRDVIVRYLRENPQSRHASARLLGQLALVESFPCPSP